MRFRTDDRELGCVFVLSVEVLGDAGVLAGVVGLHGADAEEDRVFVDRQDGDARLGADGSALVPPVDAHGGVALDHLARHRHRLALAHRVHAERERLDSRRHFCKYEKFKRHELIKIIALDSRKDALCEDEGRTRFFMNIPQHEESVEE